MKNSETTFYQELSYLALRVFGSGIFIVAGLNHLLNTATPAARLASSPFGFLATSVAPAEILIVFSGLVLLAAGILLLLGYQTRIAALMLLIVLIPITLTVQIGGDATLGPLFKNIAIIGILIYLVVNGSLAYSLDKYLENREILLSPLKIGSGLAAFFIALLLLFSPFPAITQADDTHSNTQPTSKQDYAVLISQPGHLGAAVHTAKTIFDDSKYNAGEFVVIACGRSVEAFLKDSAMKTVYEDGKAAGVTFKVCGMSLNNFDIDADSIFEEVQITPNGLTYMFDLKLQGFETVEL